MAVVSYVQREKEYAAGPRQAGCIVRVPSAHYFSLRHFFLEVFEFLHVGLNDMLI